MNQPKARKEAKRFIKFGIVGALGAVVDFSVFNALIFMLHWTSDEQKLLANIISVSVAIISNFTWNRLWTFPESQSRKKRVQLVQFTVVNLVGLILNSIIFYFSYKFFFVPMLELWMEPGLLRALAANLAKAFAIGLVLFWNFGANRLWTYRGL
jgi:putative flippase GtrA